MAEPGKRVPKIAVDAMGGDHGPTVIVPGAVLGARGNNAALALVGDRKAIEAALASIDHTGIDIDIVDASEVITMHDHPAQAVRRKRNSSINVALQLVRDGEAQAMISAGNSGAVMAASLMILGRVKGIDRPAIATYLPTIARDKKTLVVDLGAVTDPKPGNIVQFAIMGQLYAERVLGLTNPTVGLLSNGEEPTKGNLFVQTVHPLLAKTPGLNFIGNVEGKDVPMGTVDIVVTDGFTGNVVLKTAEGVVTMLTTILRQEFTSTWPRKLAALVLRPGIKNLRLRLDYAETGGAPLLGVNGMVIISHGRSSERAIETSIGAAVRSIEHDLAGGIAERIARVIPVVEEAVVPVL
jgi:glycerol-3-phosphate acyltransferase PlsX